MRVSTSKVMLAVLVVGLWSPAASAQVSKARSEMEKVKASGEALHDLFNRRSTEETAILRRAKELSEACKSAKDALKDLFEPPANVASGELKKRLEEHSKLAKDLAILLDRELIAKCTVVIDLIEGKDRGGDFSLKLGAAMTSVSLLARARAKDWEDLTK